MACGTGVVSALGYSTRDGGGLAYLFELVFLCRFVLAGFGGLPVELLCCELQVVSNGWGLKWGGVGAWTLRLKRAFSRPDIVVRRYDVAQYVVGWVVR